MKITKSQLKQIVTEEIKEVLNAEIGEGNDRAIISMLEELLHAIEGLDISVDFLASALTGRSAYDIGMEQKSIGLGATAESKGSSE